MSARGLAFDEAPPLASVLRSFLWAPWFLVAAGAVLLAAGPGALQDRYTPAVLAATHLVTIGFLMLIATAAAFQLVPVVSGASFPCVACLAPAVRWGFALGAVLLAAAFLQGPPLLFGLAAVPLAIAVGAFTLSGAWVLWRLPKHKTMAPMFYAVTLLGVALAFGLVMAGERVAGAPVSATLLRAHPLWALAGGVFVLWAAVAAQVLPMFQGARSWSPRVSFVLGPLVSALLFATLIARAWPVPAVESALRVVLAAVVVAYAGLLGQRLWTRGRRRCDAMTFFWYIGLVSLIASAVVGAFMAVGLLSGLKWPLAYGLLALMGAAASLMSGMLYKIVPFLVWLHLQRRPGHPTVLMTSAISERSMRVHAALHLATIGFSLAAIAWPQALCEGAALLWIADGALFGANLFTAHIFYQRVSRASTGGLSCAAL
ncbi:MAG: hypothetical protein ACYCTF_12065 [Acidiferrobacter sp.]